MNLPLVSVVIPTHNHGTYLLDATKSVLSQTYSNLELIIIENGSTDSTIQVLETINEPRVRAISLESHGAALARNTGVGLAQGELIAFLDADDFWLPEKLSLQIQAAESAYPDAAESWMCFTHLQEFIDPGNLTPVHEPRLLRGASATSMLIPRIAFETVGTFNETLAVGEFIDWYDRARQVLSLELNVPESLVMRRVHTGNSGKTQLLNPNSYAVTMKSILDRRRAQRPAE